MGTFYHNLWEIGIRKLDSKCATVQKQKKEAINILYVLVYVLVYERKLHSNFLVATSLSVAAILTSSTPNISVPIDNSV